MRDLPKIGSPGGVSGFHDSSLLHLELDPVEDTVSVVVTTYPFCRPR